VDLLFKLENFGLQKAKNVIFEIMPKYPFSLDPGTDSKTVLGIVDSLQDGKEAFLIRYKVRVDSDALDGENEIEVRYTYDGSAGYYARSFPVVITNPRTDFDVVLQDVSDTSITLALANIGVNTAYSVTLRIPEQEDYRVTGISSSIIGNLNAADYTLATFDMVPVYGMGNSVTERTLLVEMFYTDGIGVRRVVQKEVPIAGYSGYAANDTRPGAGFPGGRGYATRTDSTQWLTYIGIGLGGIAVIAGFFLYKRHRKKKK
jgi:LPXTG-motif cell wall-anchored protein